MKKIYIICFISLILFELNLYAQNTTPKRPITEVGTLPGKLSVLPTGNAVYKIPIEVPPGIGNMTPKLSFTYNSGINGGIMGYGWSLSGLSRISRSAGTYYYNGAPKEIDFSDDQLVLDGRKLILTDQNSNEYRYEEDNMDRIYKNYEKGKENNVYFVDYTKSGLIKTYGKPLQAKLIYGNETNPALIYFINKIEDQDGNSIKYNYESHQIEGTVYLKSIEYGGTGSNRDLPSYTIEFEYLNAELAKTSFFSIGGTDSRFKYREDKLLKRVIIKHKGEELRRYTISYEAGGLLNEKYLKSITLETSESEYKSTVFDWKYTQNTIDKTIAVYNHNIDPKPTQYRTPFIGKGDFNNDGISDLIVYNIYDTGQHEINLDLYISNGTSFTHKLNHQFNNQLLYIGCGDFNGDGTSEILFKNSNGYYKIVDFIYEPETNSYSIDEHNNLFISSLSGGFIGDYNGDGIDDFITYDSTGTGNIHYYKGDVNNYLEDGNIEDYYVGINYKIYIGDFDGGRKTELLVANDNLRKFVKIKLNYDNNEFEQHTVELTNTPTNYYDKFFSEEMPLLVLGDYNNDGKTDIIATSKDKDNNNLDLYFSYGYDFEYQKTITINKDKVLVSDVNGDGRSDIIVFKHEDDDWYNWTDVTYYYVERDGKSLTKGPTFKLYYNDDRDATVLGSFLFGKYTGTNKKDLIVSSYTVGSISDDINFEVKAFYYGETSYNKITKITNGLGYNTQIKYEPLTTSQHHETEPDYSSNYPLIKYTPSKFIVTQIYKDNGQGDFFEPVEYYYKNGITHKLGKGFLGFMGFTINNNINNISDVKHYEILGIGQHKYYKPYVKSEIKYVINDNGEIGQKFLATDITLNHKITTTNNLIFFPYVENMVTDYYTLKSGIKYKTVTVNNTNYDIYGNVGKTTITKTGYTSGSNTYITESLFDYWNDPVIENNKWAIGKLQDITVTKKFENQKTKEPIIKHTNFEYYIEKNEPYFGKLKLKVFAPEDDKAMAVKYTKYDEYGNLVSLVNNAYSNPNPDLDRTNSFEYDDSYYKRFVTKTVNPLGHETLFGYNRNWGWITKITESGNIKTTISYIDDFGKQFMKTLPDMTFYQLNYFWVSDNDQDKPEYAVYYKYETSSANPVKKTYYDKLNRKLRIVTSNSTGVIYHDFYYDSNTGKLNYETKPYFKGDEIYKIHYEYDKLGRITGKYLPGDRDYDYFYNGLTLTISNPKRQTITKHYSANNDLISVTNNLNISSLYIYDPDSRLISAMIRDREKTEIKATYDIYGNITSIDDPALKEKRFEYDVFGQLVKVIHNDFIEQKDFKYDKLGRIVEKDEPEVGHTIFSYDNQFAGKLDDITFNNYTNSDNYKTSFIYDEYDRVKQTNENIIHNGNSNDFSTIYTYSQQTGQIETLEYPSGLKIEYEYNHGDVVKIKRMADEKILWRLDKKNAFGQLEDFSYGNGIYTTKNYYPETGFLKSIFSSQPMLNRDFGHKIQNNAYTWDRLGNLLSRKKEFESGDYLIEDFYYDDLNRLTKDVINNGGNEQQWGGETDLAYDELNRILKKQSSNPDLHVANKYTYDDNGENPYKLLSIDNKPAFYYGDNQIIQYTRFDKISQIQQSIAHNGSTSQKLEISYGFSHQRKIQTITDYVTKFVQTKYYLAGGLAELVNEHNIKSLGQPTTKMISYLFAPDGLFAIDNILLSSGKEELYYVHKDHLGSVEALTDESGNLIEEYSYDAWGLRRDPKTWKPLTGSFATKTDRGFTGHEHLDLFNMINMNGRVYDPVIGYFSSPDPVIGIPNSPESFNLYVYTHNNPLSYVDPTGYYDEINDIGAQNEPIWLGEVEIIGTKVDNSNNRDDRLLMIKMLQTSIDKLVGDLKIKNTTITQTAQSPSNYNNPFASDNFFDNMNDNFLYNNDAQGYSDYNNNTQSPNEDNDYDSGEPGEAGGGSAWDLNGDGKLQKNEADNWWLTGKGVGVRVDNSKIDWTGLKIPEGKSSGNIFSISTTDAFLKLPYETAATYGGTSFKVIAPSQVEVLDQLYHYNYRPNNSVENWIRNFMTWWGKPSGEGTNYMIYYYNPNIWIK